MTTSWTILQNGIFYHKTDSATLSAMFGSNWANFYSNIWSHCNGKRANQALNSFRIWLGPQQRMFTYNVVGSEHVIIIQNSATAAVVPIPSTPRFLSSNKTPPNWTKPLPSGTYIRVPWLIQERSGANVINNFYRNIGIYTMCK